MDLRVVRTIGVLFVNIISFHASILLGPLFLVVLNELLVNELGNLCLLLCYLTFNISYIIVLLLSPSTTTVASEGIV